MNLRDEKGQLLKKGWKLVSNSQEQVRHMTLQCTNDHPHGLCEGGKTCRRSAYYTPEFAKRVVNHINLGETFEGLFGELIDGTNVVGWDSSFQGTPKMIVLTPKKVVVVGMTLVRENLRGTLNRPFWCCHDKKEVKSLRNLGESIQLRVIAIKITS